MDDSEVGALGVDVHVAVVCDGAMHGGTGRRVGVRATWAQSRLQAHSRLR